MNPAMMRCELKKRFPDVFSIPGETEIKKYINALFVQSKKNNGDGVIDDDENGDKSDDNESLTIPRAFDWSKAVKNLVEEDPSRKPKEVYEKLVDGLSDAEKAQLPDVKVVKSKVSAVKQVIRKRLLRSIVS